MHQDKKAITQLTDNEGLTILNYILFDIIAIIGKSTKGLVMA